MDLIGEFRLHDVDNCNEIYCLAFHELRQLKGQLFHSLRVAVPSPPPKVKRRRGNVYANLTLIALFPCLRFTFEEGGGEGTATRRLLILYRLGLGEGARKILEDRMVIRGNEGGGVSVVAKRVYRKVTASEGGGEGHWNTAEP